MKIPISNTNRKWKMPKEIKISFDSQSAINIFNATKEKLINPCTELIIDGNRPDTLTRKSKDYADALKYLQTFYDHLAMENRVFLGGAIGYSDWRKKIAIPRLEKDHLSYVNPYREDYDDADAQYKRDGWKGGIADIEAMQRIWSRVCLIVFTPDTRGLISLIETIESIYNPHQDTVVVFNGFIEAGIPVGDQRITQQEASEINDVRLKLEELARQTKTHVYLSVEAAMDKVVELLKS